jgi:hypothetical protein
MTKFDLRLSKNTHYRLLLATGCSVQQAEAQSSLIEDLIAQARNDLFDRTYAAFADTPMDHLKLEPSEVKQRLLSIMKELI